MISQTIKRSEWRHGIGGLTLWRDDQGDILGLCLRDAGVAVPRLRLSYSPFELQQRGGRLPRDWAWLLETRNGVRVANSPDAHEIMILNDRVGLGEAELETLLIPIFARNGVELQFV